MAEEPDDKSWPLLGKWGSLALVPLTVLFLYVTVPLAGTLLVIYAYGSKGYEQGIRVVGLYKHSFFSNGEDVPEGGTWWIGFGSFFAAVAAAFLTVYFVQRCIGHLQKLVGVSRRHDHVAGGSQEGLGRGPLSARDVVLVFGAAIVLLLGPNTWRSFDLALHEERTQGTVFRQVSPEAIIYKYTVDGREYSGAGHVRIEEVEIGEAHPKGSAVEVRYSSKHPGHSTLGDPLVFPKSILCMVGIVGGFFLIIYFTRRRRQYAAEPSAADVTMNVKAPLRNDAR